MRRGLSSSRAELVPIRHGRMLVSPFTFYRGAALVMAADLPHHPDVRPAHPAVRRRAPVQLRRLRLAERRLVFDINDFDETLPGPFEWDVKRLAASFVVAGRDNGFTTKQCRKHAGRVESYRRRCGLRRPDRSSRSGTPTSTSKTVRRVQARCRAKRKKASADLKAAEGAGQGSHPRQPPGDRKLTTVTVAADHQRPPTDRPVDD